MTTKSRVWFRGLTSAVVGGSANAITLMILKPLEFNLTDGWKSLLTAAAVSGLVNAAFFLKQSPIPPDDLEDKMENVK